MLVTNNDILNVIGKKIKKNEIKEKFHTRFFGWKN